MRLAKAKIDRLQCHPRLIMCMEEIGHGEFGVVHRGSVVVHGINTAVAVKEVKGTCCAQDQEAFLLEVRSPETSHDQSRPVRPDETRRVLTRILRC